MSKTNPPLDLEEAIASRQLEVVDLNGVQISTVFVYIGKPWLVAKHEWHCHHRIIGLGDDQTLTVIGFDAVQTIQHALIIIDSCLSALDDGRACLRWNGEMNLNFVKESYYPKQNP